MFVLKAIQVAVALGLTYAMFSSPIGLAFAAGCTVACVAAKCAGRL